MLIKCRERKDKLLTYIRFHHFLIDTNCKRKYITNMQQSDINLLQKKFFFNFYSVLSSKVIFLLPKKVTTALSDVPTWENARCLYIRVQCVLSSIAHHKGVFSDLKKQGWNNKQVTKTFSSAGTKFWYPDTRGNWNIGKCVSNHILVMFWMT